MSLRILAAAAVLAWCTGELVEQPAPARLVQEDARIPAHSGRTTLAITILRPRGTGPFGAVILNHGVPLTEDARRLESPELLLHTAAAFAERGYAVFMPLRRGFGATGGEFAEDAGFCADADYRRGEREAAADVLAAYAFARKLPYVDASRMILAGQSAGGVAALQAAAQKPPGLLAVLAFGAGRGADPARSGVPCAGARLAEVFEDLGRAVQAPVLLYYAENDLFFGPDASRAWFARFKAGGARAEYVLQPPFGANGHYVFTEAAGTALWLPAVERFLERHGIPFAPEPRAPRASRA
ncbi:MAG TPA: prolyl oligopeptidase family serine peptidase [Burkholderiales bacterium]|nr:prolyl oligopeptidase family serine peptidase [Burkholderiales bacterium]